VNEYERVLASPAWRVRTYILKALAERLCEVCGSDGALEAHHLSYDNLGNEEPQDLVVLCDACHAGAHDGVIPPDVLREIANRHPVSFRAILEAERFEGTYL